MEDNSNPEQSYTAKDIIVLGGLDGVRKRPSMYIGSTGIKGLHHLVYEIVDNSIDEAMAGFCDKIKVILHKDGKVSVSDNGRGIPIDIHPKYNKPVLELIMTTLHSGCKFDKSTYKVSGGLHGVGLSVVNALSKELELVVKKGGKIVTQKYSRGKPVNDITIIGEDSTTGTTVIFLPDEEIFTEMIFQLDII